LEADDLIAKAVYHFEDNYKKIYVLSNDDDLNQLLNIQNLILLRKNREYNWETFYEEYPTLCADDWIMLTALTGTHNAIKGIERVGTKTALKIMNDAIKLEDTYSKHKELLERNYSLIQLPYPNFAWNTIQIPKLNSPKISETGLMRYVERYGIRYSTAMMEAFSNYSPRNNNVRKN
jgi:5'-3' exonuclease